MSNPLLKLDFIWTSKKKKNNPYTVTVHLSICLVRMEYLVREVRHLLAFRFEWGRGGCLVEKDVL